MRAGALAPAAAAASRPAAAVVAGALLFYVEQPPSTQSWGGTQEYTPRGLAYHSARDLLFACDGDGHRVLVWTAHNGKFVSALRGNRLDSSFFASSRLGMPSGLCIDEQLQHCFVTDMKHDCVYVIDGVAGHRLRRIGTARDRDSRVPTERTAQHTLDRPRQCVLAAENTLFSADDIKAAGGDALYWAPNNEELHLPAAERKGPVLIVSDTDHNRLQLYRARTGAWLGAVEGVTKPQGLALAPPYVLASEFTTDRIALLLVGRRRG